jgi:hypothetical protein
LNTPRIALPNTVTEMNFGLRSAGNGRLARHGRPGQGSTYLRTAIKNPYRSVLSVLIRILISAYSASPRASNRLTRRREGAESGSAVLIRSVGQGCIRRRKQAPRATRRIGTMVNVSEKCYKRSIFISLQSLHAGVDARAPRTACGHRRPRTQDGMRAWTPAHPGRYAGIDARAPRTHVVQLFCTSL